MRLVDAPRDEVVHRAHLEDEFFASRGGRRRLWKLMCKANRKAKQPEPTWADFLAWEAARGR